MRPPSVRVLVLTSLVLATLVSAALDSGAQGVGFTEDFEDPALGEWEHGGAASAEEGVLMLAGDGFAVHPSAIDTGLLGLRLSISGEGRFEIEYRTSDAGAYVLRISRGGFELSRRDGEEHTDLGSASLDLPIDSFFDLAIDVGTEEQAVLMGDGEVLRTRDPSPLPPGGLLLRVVEGAAVLIDSIRFEPVGGDAEPPGEPVTGATVEPPGEPSGEPAWVYTGGPAGGLGYDIRMDPRDPDVMYVTDAYAGAFKSLDGGMSWFPINNGISSRAGTSGDGIPVFSLSLDPNDPDRLWAGTQFASDVFRSDDGGDTWTLTGTGIEEWGLSIRGITVQRGDPEIVYFAAEVSSHEWNREQPRDCYGLDATRGVVYRSDNGGGDWRRIWEGDNLARYVWIHPEDPNLLYVSTGIFDRCAADADPATGTPGGAGILRSRDGGATWEELGGGNGLPSDQLYFGSLYMHPTRPSVLIAASGNGVFPFTEAGQQGGIFLTEDGGDTWREVLDGHAFSGVEICEGDPDIVYAGALSGFFRSDDGGRTWTETAGALWGSPDIVAGFPIDLQCDPRDAMRIFVNNYNGGNFLSEDGGHTWIDASRGYTGALMAQIALAPSDPARLYASARGGFFSTDDGGTTWRGLGTGIARTLEGLAVAVDPNDPLHVMGTLLDAGPFPKVSRDGGSTWYGVEPDLLRTAEGDTLTRIVFGPGTDGLVLAAVGPGSCSLARNCPPDAGGGGIIRSSDGGETFTATSLTTGNASALAPFPGDDSVWYAYVPPQGLLASGDAGQSWQPIETAGLPEVPPETPDGVPPPIVVSLAVDPTDPGRLYAGLNRRAVVFSNDGGVTWESAATGIPPEATVIDIVIDPTDPSVIYLGTLESGVFRSVDRGVTWSGLNQGLLSRAVTDLALSADGRTLYAGTTGAGVFRLDLSGEPPTATTSTQAPRAPTTTTHSTPPAATGDEPAGTSVPWVPIGTAAAGIVLLAAVFAVLRRRRG